MIRSIKGKFYFLYFSSTILFLFLIGFFVVYSILEYNKSKDLVREIKAFNEISTVIHFIQKERGLTAKYITSPTPENRSILDAWRNKTTSIIENSPSISLFPNAFEKLTQTRNSVYTENNFQKHFFEYTVIINNLLGKLYIDSFFEKLPQKDIYYHMFNLAMTREYLGTIRAYVFSTLKKQEISNFDRYYITERYQLFLMNNDSIQEYLQKNLLKNEFKESLHDSLNKVDIVIESVLNKNHINIDNEEWFSTCSNVLNYLFQLSAELQDSFETKLHQQKNRSSVYLLITAFIAPIFIIITLRIVYKFISSFSERVATIDRKMKLILGTNNFSIEFNEMGNDEISNISSSLNNLLRLTRKLIQEKDKIASHDLLTGLFNRRKFIELFNTELNRSIRYNTPFCIMIMDIDFFKKINDTYGHNIGDEILVSIANIVSESIRKVDVFARWGGEEFVILLPSSNINVSTELAEKLRKMLADFIFPHNIRLTMSFGLTEILPEDTLEKAIARADTALYQSKHSGRNKVTAYVQSN